MSSNVSLHNSETRIMKNVVNGHTKIGTPVCNMF